MEKPPLDISPLQPTRKKRVQPAFYQASRKTSAEIISDARRSVKSVSTKRPFTPLEGRGSFFADYPKAPPPHGLPPTGFSSSSPLTSLRSGSKRNENEEPASLDPLPQRLLPSPPKSHAPKLSTALSRRRASLPKITRGGMERRVQSGPTERTALHGASAVTSARSPSLSNLNQLVTIRTQADDDDDTTRQETVVNDRRMDRRLLAICSSIGDKVDRNDVDGTERDLETLLVALDRETSWRRTVGAETVSHLNTYFDSFVQQCWPDVKLKACKVLLVLNGSVASRAVVCKELLEITRSSQYDDAFIREGIINDILAIATNVDLGKHSRFVLTWASLVKMLCYSDTTKHALYSSGCVEVLACLLESVIARVDSPQDHVTDLRGIAVQVTGALRKLADIIVAKKSFISTGILRSVLLLCRAFIDDLEFVMNVAGMLSKLTQNGDCVAAMVESRCDLNIMFSALRQHMHEMDVVVRICFILGNLAAKVESSRTVLAFSPDGLDVMATAATCYLDVILRDDVAPLTKEEDVVVKVVRAFANLCIEEDVARRVANHRPVVDVILRLLGHRNETELGAELLVNACVAVNNISYFAETSSYFSKNELALTRDVAHLVTDQRGDVSLEAIRVLGNLTLSLAVRQLLHNDKCLEWIVCLLDSSQNDLVYAACGVLVNLMIDRGTRQLLLPKDHGMTKLIDALEDFAPSDWQLAGLMCQILANYSEDSLDATDCFGEELKDRLLAVLATFLDAEFVADVVHQQDAMAGEQLLDNWENDFVPVAKIVQARLESIQSQYESLPEQPAAV